MPIGITDCCRVVLDVAVEIEALRVAEVCVGYVGWFRCPVGRHKPAEAAAVVPGTEHVEARFTIPFFAGELVVVGIASGGGGELASVREVEILPRDVA